MRIISGKFKGVVFEFRKNKDIRPTQNMVKEAMFNILGATCDGAAVLDLCCGTGSLGLEALSRNAASVQFVDSHCDIVQKNIDTLKKKDPTIQVRVFRSPAYPFLKRCKSQWDIIFLDPPWDKHEVYKSALNAIVTFGILAPSGILLCESRRSHKLHCPEGLVLEKEYIYGDTKVSVIKAL